MNILDIILFVTLLIITIILFSLNVTILNGKPFGNIITTAGIGSILAGTFFGVVRNILINKPIDGTIIYLIIFLFFFWYILTKGIGLGIQSQEKSDAPEKNPQIVQTKTDEIKISKEKGTKPTLSNLYKGFISIIIFFVMLILILSTYNQSSTGGSLYVYNILITCMVSLAVFFSYFSGSRLDNNTKIEIISYTISYAIIFGVLAPIFVFNSFSMKSSFTSVLIFFIWLSISNSIANFVQDKPTVIHRN